MNTLKRKLTIKSSTIANLNGEELIRIKGGAPETVTCEPGQCIEENTNNHECDTYQIGCVPQTEQDSCENATFCQACELSIIDVCETNKDNNC